MFSHARLWICVLVIGARVQFAVSAEKPVDRTSWVQVTPGPQPGDEGPRIDAIVRREMINARDSSARLEDGSRITYNHPSMLCETREGTLIFMWNGGPSEGESSNRIFFPRRDRTSKACSEPVRLESRQIDFGTLYQPKKADAPVIAGYWLGVPRRSPAALRWSYDDGQTWTERRSFPETTTPFWAAAPARGRFRLSMSPPVEFPDGTLWWASEQEHRKPAIVVVPPDNYTGHEPDGSAWSSIQPPTFRQGVHGNFLVLSSDYKSIIFVNRQGGDYVTHDRGITWKEVKGIPKGGAGVGAVSLDIEGGPAQGWHVVAGSAHPRRDGLHVSISDNPEDPKSWRRVLTLHRGKNSEDADPSLIQGQADRRIHLLFTGRGENKLKYYVLDSDTLISRKPPALVPTAWALPPSNLKATKTNGKAVLTWRDNADNEDGYRIVRKLQEDGHPWLEIGKLKANSTTFTDRPEPKPQRYSYKVQAFNASGDSQLSNAAYVSGK